MIKQILSVFFYLSVIVGSVSAQENRWQYEYTAQHDSLEAIQNVLKDFNKRIRADRNAASEKIYSEHVGEFKQHAGKYNNYIAQCNSIHFPNTEPGNNCSAELWVLTEIVKMELTMAQTELQILADIIQKAKFNELVKSLVSEVLQIVISKYIPFVQ